MAQLEEGLRAMITSSKPSVGVLVALGCGAVLVLWFLVSSIAAWLPLRHVPGPFLAKFSYLWLLRSTYSGKQYYIHRALHKRYGGSPLVRIGPKYVITDDPEVIRRMSSARSGYHRDAWYETGRFNPWRDNLFTLTDPVVHSKAKLRLAGSYNGRETAGLEAGVDEQVRNLVALVRRKYAVPVNDNAKYRPLMDLGPISNYFTLDVITKVAFGTEFGYVAAETDHHSFLSHVRNLWPRMSTSADVPWLRRVLFSRPFLALFGPRTRDAAGFGALMAVAERHVAARFRPGAEVLDDSLGSLIRKGLTREECESEGLFLIVGGTESTASAIRSILAHTMSAPRVYQALKAEIRQATRDGTIVNNDGNGDGDDDVIRNQDAAALSYLRAVVYEGIRMRPPLLGLFPKVVPSGGDTLAGVYVPGGTAVCMNTSSLLRRADLFGADAAVFRPERFTELGDLTSARRLEMERNVELAFGYGMNMCVGKPLALMEIYKAVFELYRRFDLQLVSPTLANPESYLGYGVFLEWGMMVRVFEDPEAAVVAAPRVSEKLVDVEA